MVDKVNIFPLSFIGSFRYGKKEDQGKQFYCNKKVQYEGNFFNDKPYGENCKFFGENGTLESQYDFYMSGIGNEPEGFGMGRRYFKNGKLKYQGLFNKGQICGDLLNFKIRPFVKNAITQYNDDGTIELVKNTSQKL